MGIELEIELKYSMGKDLVVGKILRAAVWRIKTTKEPVLDRMTPEFRTWGVAHLIRPARGLC